MPGLFPLSLSGTLPTRSHTHNESFVHIFQILIGEVTSFFVKTEGAQEKTIVTADCCYFNPLVRRIVRFLGQFCDTKEKASISIP